MDSDRLRGKAGETLDRSTKRWSMSWACLRLTCRRQAPQLGASVPSPWCVRLSYTGAKVVGTQVDDWMNEMASLKAHRNTNSCRRLIDGMLVFVMTWMIIYDPGGLQIAVSKRGFVFCVTCVIRLTCDLLRKMQAVRSEG